MWTILLLLFLGMGALATGAVISACVLSGRIEDAQTKQVTYEQYEDFGAEPFEADLRGAAHAPT